jgi:hypothetical protein
VDAGAGTEAFPAFLSERDSSALLFVTFVQVKRLVAAPAALAGPRPAGHRALHPVAAAAGDQARPASAAWPASPRVAPLPAETAAPAGQPDMAAADVTALLDEAFGVEPG